MRSFCLIQNLGQAWQRITHLSIVVLAALMALGSEADARGDRTERPVESIDSRTAGEPVMAIVSLREQRITVYDANGWILRSPVSSGSKGRETPAGIFSILQKNAEHYSNLYDDAYMPHMQRITWSGIALHGGALPGYPASHGCVRLPFDFAARLFDQTRLGLRVIVAPTDVMPAEVDHSLLFQQNPEARALATKRTLEANEAARNADQARIAVGRAIRESSRVMMPVRIAENLKLRTEFQLPAAETAIASATSPEAKEQAEDAKAKLVARIAELEVQRTAAKAEVQPKLDAITLARENLKTAEAARIAAAEAARQVMIDLEPVSVFVSRKTQRLYVRRAFEPVLESPVAILDADRPIGTYVFTATEPSGGDSKMKWNVVSLASHSLGVGDTRGRASEDRHRRGEPMTADRVGAMAALDRIAIPQEVLDRITGIASPRSSLIISDEELSTETGKNTDFVVVLNDEPQGGIKKRRAAGVARPRDRLTY